MPDEPTAQSTAESAPEPLKPKVTRARATTSAPRPGRPASPASPPEPAPEPMTAAAEPATESAGRAGHGPADEDIALARGARGRVEAREVVVSVGAIGVARAEKVSVERGAIGAAMGREIRLSQGAAQAVLAGNARFEQAFVRSVMAGRVEMGRGSAAGVVIAGRVDGDVRTLVDWRGALAFGAAFGLAWALFGRRR